MVERRVVTPDPSLMVVKIGDESKRADVSPQENASSLFAKLAKVIAKPGTSRSQVFRSGSGRRVYAYSVFAADPSKLVREDAKGTKTVGRLVNGRFRAVSRDPNV